MCVSLATASSVTVVDYACTAALPDLVHHSWSDNSYEMMTINLQQVQIRSAWLRRQHENLGFVKCGSPKGAVDRVRIYCSVLGPFV